MPQGTNFSLAPGTFIWADFGGRYLLDLGDATCAAVDLSAGVNAVSYACFPDRYRSFQLLRELGASAVSAVRMLDSRTGRWRVASFQGGEIRGEGVRVPRRAALIGGGELIEDLHRLRRRVAHLHHVGIEAAVGQQAEGTDAGAQRGPAHHSRVAADRSPRIAPKP